MTRLFIIAGNHVQYLNYVQYKNRQDYVYVSSTDRLRGYHKPHGLFIGTWYRREDLGEIIMQLRLASSIDQEKVMELLEHRRRYLSSRQEVVNERRNRG